MSDNGQTPNETSDPTDSSANLDPRIGMRLEDLNKWTGKINALETSYEEANSNFRSILSESSNRLKSLALKLGKCVEESRPYYEARGRLIEVQSKCQRAAINYEKACQAYLEAKERINLAERKFVSASVDEFDTTWQEMLNQANIKLMEAETMKKESERLHQQSMKDFHFAERVVLNLERKLKGSLQKSKIYFDEKRRFQEQLALVKEEIELTLSQISCSKARYASTLRELEAISEEIHEKRACSLLKHLKREPGDGAEFNPGLISLDSCEIMINSQLAKLDLQINETLNCQHPTEPSQTPSLIPTTDHPEDHNNTVNNSCNQASTSDAITINCSSSESNHSHSSDKEDKEDEDEDEEIIYSDVNTGDDDDDDDADDEESPISSTDERTKDENIEKITKTQQKDQQESEKLKENKLVVDSDQDDDDDDDEYEDVVDEIKISSQSTNTNNDQLNALQINGSLKGK